MKANLNAAFKRWFAGSKVVDGDGKPLVCYHMTPGDFDRFKVGLKKTSKGHHVSGPAIWFAPDPEHTSAAHHTHATQMTGGAGLPRWDGEQGWGYRVGTNVMPCYLRVVNPLEIWPGDVGADARKAAGLPRSSYYLLDADVRNMQAMNIDGVFTYADDLTIREIVIFSPAQAKSVFNPGTWSRASHALLDGLGSHDNSGARRFVLTSDRVTVISHGDSVVIWKDGHTVWRGEVQRQRITRLIAAPRIRKVRENQAREAIRSAIEDGAIDTRDVRWRSVVPLDRRPPFDPYDPDASDDFRNFDPSPERLLDLATERDELLDIEFD